MARAASILDLPVWQPDRKSYQQNFNFFFMLLVQGFLKNGRDSERANASRKHYVDCSSTA